jgi:hypothetical protein
MNTYAKARASSKSHRVWYSVVSFFLAHIGKTAHLGFATEEFGEESRGPQLGGGSYLTFSILLAILAAGNKLWLPLLNTI